MIREHCLYLHLLILFSQDSWMVFSVQIFHIFVMFLLKYFILFDAIVILICSLLVYRNNN